MEWLEDEDELDEWSDESESECDESESESEEDDESASSIAHRCSIINFGAFYNKANGNEYLKIWQEKEHETHLQILSHLLCNHA